jgi:hypothetical protein
VAQAVLVVAAMVPAGELPQVLVSLVQPTVVVVVVEAVV